MQGVGFRPFVYRHAVALGLVGTVRNDRAGVLIDVQGDGAGIAALERVLTEAPPPMARVTSVVTRVVPDAEVESAAQEIAMSLAQGPSVTLGYIKRNINNAETMSLEACFDAEAIHHSRSGETADHKEAAKAFVEKRKPVFQGH